MKFSSSTKFTFVLLLLSFLAQVSLAQESYDQVRIWTDDTDGIIREILSFGIDPEGLDVRQNVYVNAIVNQREKEQLESLDFPMEDLVVDLSSYYAARLTQGAVRELGYGSMGGYLTFDEVVSEMDSLQAQFPNIVSPKQSIGVSFEGRDIWAFRISDNPETDEGEPEVLYNSLIHAREPAAMMTLMYFARSLAENYNTDPVMSYLVDEREMWFVPVINPDGYIYNQLTNPDGGGMHRKNRHPGCSSSPGIDLNRNWGYQWGFDDNGSSPDSCENVYRGPNPFSEPETQALRDFVLAHDFQTIFNYHSYGNLLIKPFGYDPNVSLPQPEHAIYTAMGEDLVADNHYLFGTGAQTVGYLVNGDAVDYMFGELGIINFTPEVGSWELGGFWPPTEMIFELARENLSMNTHLAGSAGSWTRIESFELISPDGLESGSLVAGELQVANKGLDSDDLPVILHFSSPDSSILPSVSELDVSGLAAQTNYTSESDSLRFEIVARSGNVATLVLSIEMSGYLTQVDTFKWNVGIPDTILLDDFENGMDAWTSNRWGILEDQATSDNCMTDSPLGDYSASTNSVVTLNEPIDVRGYSNLMLSMDVKWAIEAHYDFCQVLASNDNGNTWIALEGLYTIPGNGSVVQPLGEHGYDGSHNWIEDQFNLNQFLESSSLLFRLQLMSDTYYEEDGISIDDFKVLGWGSGFLSGDVNQDGLVNVADAVSVIQTITTNETLDETQMELADLNQDTSLDIRDIVLLIEIILGE